MIFSKTQCICVLTLIFIVLLPATSFGRSARAMFLGATADMPKEAILLIGGGLVTVDLPSRFLSPEIELPSAPSTAVVLQTRPLPDEEINPAAPVIRFPEESTRCLLLFIPDASNSVFPARVIVIDASPSKFPAGNTIIFNLSKANIAGKFGDQEVKVGAGQKRVLNPPRSDAGSYPVHVACQISPDADWVTLCSSTWRHHPKVRQLMFVAPHNERKFPRIWTVTDYPQVKEQ